MRRLAGTLAVVLFIAGTVFFFIVRTDGARARAEQMLSARLGIEMQVEEMRIGWPYVLVLRDAVSTTTGAGGEPLLRLGEARIWLGLSPRWRVAVRQAGVRLPADERAMREWPTPLRRLREADLTDLDEVSRLADGLRERMAFTLEDGRIEWLDDQGMPAGYAHGVKVQWQPVRLPSQAMHWHSLELDEYEPPTGDPLSDLRREWLLNERLERIDLPVPGARRDSVCHEEDKTGPGQMADDGNASP